jgi:hypothetical protein
MFGIAVFLVILLVFLGGCTKPPTVEIAVATTEIPLGKEASISAQVSGQDLRFQWTLVGKGKLLEPTTESAVIYVADELGTATVNVEVTGKGGTTIKGVNLIVVESTEVAAVSPSPPTDTPTPTPTNTSTPTNTCTPTPTNTSTPTYTPVPPTATPTPTNTLAPPPTDTPTNTPSPIPAVPPPPTPLPSSAPVVNAIRVAQPPTIDGRLDEGIWSQAQPLAYAEHPPKNDATTAVVRLLWDDKYLYAGFDVSDTQVEGSSATPWDGDSVSIVFDNGGQIQECRHSLLDDGWATATTERHLKGATTFDDSSDQDEGYSIEMRIPWVRTPDEGSTIAADFLSVDHDYNPGRLFNDPGTVFSKKSWDGDGKVNTALKGILLSG